MDKLTDIRIGAFLAGYVCASVIVFLVVLYNNIKNSEQEFCNIFFTQKT